MPEAPIRLLIVDDHPVVRDGLSGMFAGDPRFEVVGEAADGGEAVAMAETLAPDVVLMDLRMPRVAGATGYLLKDTTQEELFRAVGAAARASRCCRRRSRPGCWARSAPPWSSR